MDDSLLKETHPQKYYMKSIMKFMYRIGMGDCWYESNEVSKGNSKIYRIWAAISNFFVFIVVCNELLAHFRSNLSNKEKNDLMQFSIAHPIVYSKILTLYLKKNSIIVVMERLLEGPRSIFTSMDLEKASIKQANRYFLALVGPLYACLLAALFDGIRIYYEEGLPIRAEVVLYPTPTDTGIFVNFLRFMVEFHWYYMMAMMLCVDLLVCLSLVIVSCKFKILQLYYRNMRSKVLENMKIKTQKELKEEFIDDFVTGIKMHDDALWCARNVQDSMGTIYSLQVMESVGLIVITLVKMVAVERNTVNLLANLFYMSCVVSITGSYMMAGGDITCEADLVSSSIFYSGWELIQARSELRVLAVVAIQRSQVPVQMTAFGVITLSYTNFISVLRSSYSFFAVMY